MFKLKKLHRRPKYGNKITYVGPLKFPSKAEADRFIFLKMLERSGTIANVEMQVKFVLNSTGNSNLTPYSYIADFTYEVDGQKIIEDVKSPALEEGLFKLKARLVEVEYGLKVHIVHPDKVRTWIPF